MKYIVELLAVLLVSSLLSLNDDLYSQSGWFIQPSGTNTFLWDISFPNSSTGYISSDGGRILKTTNEGNNWVVQNLGTAANMLQVQFINSLTGFTCGSAGIFYKTTNGGVNWVQKVTPTLNAVQSLFFVDENTGFIGGGSGAAGELYKTTNSGGNWVSYGQGVFGKTVMDIVFLNSITGYIGCYDASVKKTTNGGINWISQSTGLDTAFGIFGIYFNDVNTGYASSAGGSIIKTTNGGENWSNIYTSTYSIVSVFFTGVDKGYAVGGSFTDMVVYKTNNAGAGWMSETLPVSGHANDIFFTSENTGYIAAENGIIYKTTNGGNTIGITQIGINIPQSYSLGQNYPNPFNPVTKIKIDIPAKGSGFKDAAKLAIYDVAGREVSLLVNQDLAPGSYEAEWNAAAHPSGVYFYTLTYGAFTQTKKMMLVK